MVGWASSGGPGRRPGAAARSNERVKRAESSSESRARSLWSRASLHRLDDALVMQARDLRRPHAEFGQHLVAVLTEQRWSRANGPRSEERRVGKECRSRWSAYR